MMRRLLLVLSVLLGLAVGPLAGAALAAPGDLDPTFGAGGIALTSPGTGMDKATAMAVQSDGAYVVAGTHTDGTTFTQTCSIVRFLSDGSLDPTFGSSWGVGERAPGVARNWAIRQILVDAAGRIYVCGGYSSILRLLSDGQVDTTFGNGGVADAGAVGNPGPAEYPPYLALYPGGGLVVGGGVRDPIHQGDIAVLRLQDDGSPDASFGTGGLFRMDVASGSEDWFGGITVAGNGDVLVVGSIQQDSLLLRLTASGSLSPSFGTSGLVLLGSPTYYRGDVFERPDGSLLVARGNSVTRLSATGVVDTTYGTNGTVGLQNPTNSSLTSMLLQSDGSIVRAGRRNAGYPTYADVLVTRNLADGSIDLGFGTNGTVVTNLGGADDSAAAAIGPDGKLVVAGYAYPSGSASVRRNASGGRGATVFGMGLIRYLVGPSARVKPSLTRLSPAFGRRGVAVTLTGKGFGSRRATSYVKFGAVKVTKYVSWSKTRIKCRVPAKARYGRVKVVVVTAGGASSARTFTVKR